jgi:membrane-associated phospholipid phosphatase
VNPSPSISRQALPSAVNPSPAVDIFAKSVSIIFHPGFQQVYIVLYFTILFGNIARTWWPILVFTFAVPTLFYMWYKKTVLAGESIYHMHRRDRFWPTFSNILGTGIFVGVMYAMGLGTVPFKLQPLVLNELVLGCMMLFITILGLGITFFYKISFHMLGTAFSSFVFYTEGNAYVFLLYILTIVPLVAWSRLYLRGHTIDQVVVGTAMGLLSSIMVLALMEQFA